VAVTLAAFLIVLLAILFVGVREAILFFKWIAHLKRARSLYWSRRSYPG
jgi:hypothetical protein